MQPWRLFADLYEGDPDPNFKTYADAGHLRVLLKATEGAYHIDSMHSERTRQAHHYGLRVGHYHFARPDEGPIAHKEAAIFWAIVKPLWRPGDWLEIDFEPRPGHVWAAPRHYIPDLCGLVHQRSHQRPWVYGDTSFLRAQTDRRWLARMRRHEAAYGPPPAPWLPRHHWQAWQRSDGVVGPDPHRLPGIPSGDVNELWLPVAISDRARARRYRAKRHVGARRH